MSRMMVSTHLRRIRGLETKPYEEMLKELKRGLRTNMITLFKYLKGSCTEEKQDLFSLIPDCKTHDKRPKLQEAGFRLNIE